MLPKQPPAHSSKMKFEHPRDLLDISSINEFLSIIFELPLDRTLKIAEICYYQTDGNSFLIFQYISHLITQGVIYEGEDTSEWQINYQKIRSAGVPEYVAQYYLKNLKIDSVDLKKAVGVASILGMQFSTELLRKSLGFSDFTVNHTLELLKKQHIFFKFNAQDGSEQNLRFNHKIIQQYCSHYSFEIEEDEFILQFLSAISDSLPLIENSATFFEVFEMFNRKFAANLGSTQKKKFISLTLKIANQEVLNENLEPTIDLLESTLSVIPSQFWINYKDDRFDISMKLVAYYFRARKFSEGEKIMRELFAQPKKDSEKAQLYYYSVIFASIQRKGKIAWGLSRKAMADLGLIKAPLPKFSNMGEFRVYFIRRLANLRNFLEREHQIIRDSRAEYALKILAAASPQGMLNPTACRRFSRSSTSYCDVQPAMTSSSATLLALRDARSAKRRSSAQPASAVAASACQQASSGTSIAIHRSSPLAG